MGRMYDSAAWRGPGGLRERALQRDGYQCAKCGRVSADMAVDHIVPIRDAPHKAHDLDNLQSLCSPCHGARKQREEAHGYDDAIGPDGWPVDPRHPAMRRSA